MSCQLFAHICSNCQEITKISKCSESPEHSAIGNIYRDILLLGITCITLQHVIKQLPVGLMVLSYGMVHFLEIEKRFNKLTKTMWL